MHTTSIRPTNTNDIFSENIFCQQCIDPVTSLFSSLMKEFHESLIYFQTKSFNFYNDVASGKALSQVALGIFDVAFDMESVDAQLRKTEQQLSEITAPSVYVETAKVLSGYIDSYFYHNLMDACTIVNRPDWLSSYVYEQDGKTHYTQLGLIVCHLYQSHRDDFKKTFFCNAQNAIYNFVKCIDESTKQNEYLFCDLICNNIQAMSAHFDAENHNAAISYDETAQNELLHKLAEKCILLLFPKRADDIFVPVHTIFHQFLGSYIFTYIEDQKIESLLKCIFEKIASSKVKNFFFLQFFELVKGFVNEVPASEPIVERHAQYSRHEEFSGNLATLIETFLKFVDEEFLESVKTVSSVSDFGSILSERITEFMTQIPSLSHVEFALEQLCCVVNPTGEWDENEEGQKRYRQGAFTFPKTAEDLLEMTQKHEVETRIAYDEAQKSARMVGCPPKGLVQMVHHKLVLKGSIPSSTPPAGVWQHAVGAVQTVGGHVSRNIIEGGMYCGGITTRINSASTLAFEKLQHESHNSLLFSIVKNVV